MTILLVDDSAAQRAALAAILETAGFHELREAGSADVALAILSDAAPGSIDLCLTDLYMPGSSGIEVCRRVRALPAWRDLPLIVVTSSGESADLDQAFAAGAMDYITKPPHEVELLARVRSALRLKQETDRRKARERELERLNQDLAAQHRLLQAEQERSASAAQHPARVNRRPAQALPRGDRRSLRVRDRPLRRHCRLHRAGRGV